MKAQQFYAQIKSLQNDLPLDFPTRSKFHLDFYEAMATLLPKNSFIEHHNEITAFLNNYHIPKSFYSVVKIDFLNALELHENLLVFATLDQDYVCINANNNVTLNDFSTLDEMALCAVNPEKFLDILFLFAHKSVQFLIGHKIDLWEYVNKMIEVGGKESSDFYEFFLGIGVNESDIIVLD
jgi:hypothetical protein